MSEPVRASIRIAAPPDRVFEFFVRPERLTAWMGEFADLDPTPGGAFAVDVRGAPVRRLEHLVAPAHRLVVSWGYAGSDTLPPGASTVEFRLTATDEGTLVEVEHRGLPPGEQPGHDEGWEHYLARLDRVVGSGDAGPDPGHEGRRPPG
jgi:uncharacterized protein YndB with AHSA1/START domain